jgi:hypothetical protein
MGGPSWWDDAEMGSRGIYCKLLGGVIIRSPFLAGLSAFGVGLIIGTILRATGLHF